MKMSLSFLKLRYALCAMLFAIFYVMSRVFDMKAFTLSPSFSFSRPRWLGLDAFCHLDEPLFEAL
jgi:hypothetical protein